MNEPSTRPQPPSRAPATGGQPPVTIVEGDALMAGGGAPDQPVVSGVMDTFVEMKPAVPLNSGAEAPPGVPPVNANVDVNPPAPAPGASPPVEAAPAVDLPGGNVNVGVTVGGADLGIGTEDSPGEGGDNSGNSGNGNAGSNSSGNGNGNSGNGDNSNQGREDDDFHGLARKK
jgi:hypothetical protein